MIGNDLARQTYDLSLPDFERGLTMGGLIQTEKFPKTSELFNAVREQFEKGAEAVDLVQGSQIIGTLLSREAAQRAMARKVAEQWIANPDILDELTESLEETPEKWE